MWGIFICKDQIIIHSQHIFIILNVQNIYKMIDTAHILTLPGMDRRRSREKIKEKGGMTPPEKFQSVTGTLCASRPSSFASMPMAMP